MKLKEIKEYHDNGKLWIHYFEDELGKRQGKFIKYWENGSKWYEIDYKDNKRTGKCIWYHENGKIEAIEYYKNNKQIFKEEYIKNKLERILNI